MGRVLAIATAAMLAVSGCASGGGGAAAGGVGESGEVMIGVVGSQTDGEPQQGGSLAFGSLVPVSSLDPLVAYPSGATGGTEMAALYDLLVRYDAEARAFEPQLAEGLTSSDDMATWTLKLRDGVRFSDGAALDSAAVVYSINRFNAGRGLNFLPWTEAVESMETPDASTVVFNLRYSWSEFPALLTLGHGMVVPESAGGGASFTPIGAGAYKVERFAPMDQLVLAANDDYWGSRPNLDKVSFVNISGDDQRMASFRSGDLDVAYLRNPKVVRARDAGTAGFVETQSLGSIGLINSREGRPGADVRVRQAIAYGIDPVAMDQRVNDGAGLAGSDIFPAWSQWNSDVSGLGYDPDKARELLDAAKADGYDGKLELLTVQSPESQSRALSVQAMLNLVGFDVDIAFVNNAADVAKRVRVDRDYDMNVGALNLFDSAPHIRLASTLAGDSPTNPLGYANADMDAQLQRMRFATTDDDKKQAAAGIQKVMNETVPFVTWGAVSTFTAWGDDVHGVKPSLDSILLLDQAWIGA